MASNDSNISFCPVCSKSFNAKKPEKAIKSHIQRAAASGNADISMPHQQWIDQHSVRDRARDRRKVRLDANSRCVARWRASHPEETKQQNAKARKKLERKRKREDQPATDYLDEPPLTPPSARPD